MSTYLHNVGNIRIAFARVVFISILLFYFIFFQIELKGLRVSPFNFDILLIVFGYFTPCFGCGQWRKYYYRLSLLFSFFRHLDKDLWYFRVSKNTSFSKSQSIIFHLVIFSFFLQYYHFPFFLPLAVLFYFNFSNR
jgi:hypothetical protein